MKKELSLQDHILLGHFLKVAHIASLKGSIVLANKDGKNKSAYLRLKQINDDLFQFRSELENIMYQGLISTHHEHELRQIYLGPFNRELLKNGEYLLL